MMFVWRFLAGCLLLLTAIPLVTIGHSYLTEVPADLLHHGYRVLLPNYALHSLLLSLAVASGAGLLGFLLAYVVSWHTFPGRRLLSGLLILPLALPGYIMGYGYMGVFEVFGLRLEGFWPTFGALVLGLYPYVYVPCQLGMTSLGAKAVEAAHSSGVHGFELIYRVIWPLCRPFWLAGIGLVGMETLADFGTVSLFGYDTLAVGIYKAWVSLFSLTLAAQFAGFLLILAILYLYGAHLGTSAPAYAFANEGRKLRRQGGGLYLSFLCGAVVFFAVLLPLLPILAWSYVAAQSAGAVAELGQLTLDTLIIGLVTSTLVVVVALGLCLCQRLFRERLFSVSAFVGRLGYALPGSVLAVGLYVPIIHFDNHLADMVKKLSGKDPGLILTGTVALVALALMVRFLNVGLGQISSSLKRLPLHLDEAALNLGTPPLQVMRRLHWPLLKKSLIPVFILTLIDCFKEMPMTLMTRPFGWDTLAVRIFEYTSEGEWVRAALPSLLLVLIGAAAVLYSQKRSAS